MDIRFIPRRRSVWLKIIVVVTLFTVFDVVRVPEVNLGVRAQRMERPVITEVSASQLQALLDRRGKVLLDVRLKGECGPFTLLVEPGNLLVSYPTTLGTTASEDEGVLAAEELVAFAKGHPVLKRMVMTQRALVVVCCQGIRSQAVARVLHAEGFRVFNLTAGMLDPSMPNQLFTEERPRPPEPPGKS